VCVVYAISTARCIYVSSRRQTTALGDVVELALGYGLNLPTSGCSLFGRLTLAIIHLPIFGLFGRRLRLAILHLPVFGLFGRWLRNWQSYVFFDRHVYVLVAPFEINKWSITGLSRVGCLDLHTIQLPGCCRNHLHVVYYAAS